MGPGAVAVTQADDRIAILQRSGPLRATKRAASIARMPARGKPPGRTWSAGTSAAAMSKLLTDGECGTREGQQGQRGEQALEREQSPGLGAGTGRPCPNTYRIAGRVDPCSWSKDRRQLESRRRGGACTRRGE